MPAAPDGGPGLEAEQAYVDWSYDCLKQMHDRAAFFRARTMNLDEIAHWARRVHQLEDNGRALCFGRIDTEDGERWYIGRRHVETVDGDPVVIEWRVPVAVPFYRASPVDAHGLRRRRQFVADGRTLLSMADDLFGPLEPGAGADQPLVRGRDALLAELERGRTGEMLDIVATIQVEQDLVIRSPQAGVLAVQGGPGSGKTAVGLHRAAFLLYGNDDLARAGVLVVGPNRTFLRYIATVLPSLGEEAVLQTTLADLVPEARVIARDTVEAERVKGDARMTEVLARALAELRRPPEDELAVRYGVHTLWVAAEDVAALLDGLVARRAPYNTGRTAAREQLLRLVFDAYRRRVGSLEAADYSTVASAVRRDPEFQATLDRIWPAVSSPALVRDVLTSPSRLARAADGILAAAEQRAILRRPAPRLGNERWTEADLPLIDEVEHQLEGRGRTYGHVVVDEAQDLSPMQLRMLARRCPQGSMTILGDLAQASGVWAHEHWDEVIAHLPTPYGHRIEELRLGYRAPGRVLDFASRLLAVAAPQVRPTESIRPGRTDPALVRVAGGDGAALAAATVAEATRLAGLHGSVAVIAPSSRYDEVVKAAVEAGVDAVEAGTGGLDHAVTLLPATAARGLEFDAVVVVEPADIVADAPSGLRLLYICLTRPTQHLSVVHAKDLPAPL